MENEVTGTRRGTPSTDATGDILGRMSLRVAMPNWAALLGKQAATAGVRQLIYAEAACGTGTRVVVFIFSEGKT